MVKIKELDRGLEITCIHEEKNRIENMTQFCCSNSAELEYIGKRVTKKRKGFTLVKYKNQIYYLDRQGCFLSGFILYLCEFPVSIDDTEPMEEYKYSVDYYNPAIDRGRHITWYYKEAELLEAKKQQRELGDLAHLREI